MATVYISACTGCGTCIDVCPMEAIKIKDEVAVISESACIGCGVCADNCPMECINID